MRPTLADALALVELTLVEHASDKTACSDGEGRPPIWRSLSLMANSKVQYSSLWRRWSVKEESIHWIAIWHL